MTGCAKGAVNEGLQIFGAKSLRTKCSSEVYKDVEQPFTFRLTAEKAARTSGSNTGV